MAAYDLIINHLKKQNRNNNITFTAKFNHSRYSLTTLSSALQMIFFIDTAVLTTAATASFTTDSTWKKQFYLYINHHKQQPITLNQFLMAHNWHTHANSRTAVWVLVLKFSISRLLFIAPAGAGLLIYVEKLS